MKCFVCGEFGHVRQTCPRRDKPAPALVPAVGVENSERAAGADDAATAVASEPQRDGAISVPGVLPEGTAVLEASGDGLAGAVEEEAGPSHAPAETQPETSSGQVGLQPMPKTDLFCDGGQAQPDKMESDTTTEELFKQGKDDISSQASLDLMDDSENEHDDTDLMSNYGEDSELISGGNVCVSNSIVKLCMKKGFTKVGHLINVDSKEWRSAEDIASQVDNSERAAGADVAATAVASEPQPDGALSAPGDVPEERPMLGASGDGLAGAVEEAAGPSHAPAVTQAETSPGQRSGHSPRCSPEKLRRRRAFSGTSHILCVSCLGQTHADHALSLGGCPECEVMSMATLRARLASFSVDPAPPLLSSGPRRKKRRSQRTPEASATSACMPDLSPCASLSASPTSITAGQPPAVDIESGGDDAEGDSCSILASDCEGWSGSIPDPAPSLQESSGVRSTFDAELLRLLTKAVEDLGLDWSLPDEPAPSRLDGCFLPGRRSTPHTRPAPFLPELHEELTKSWKAPFSARLRSTVSSTLSLVDGAKDKGYLCIPPVEEPVATHLCPPSAGWQSHPSLPSKACRTTSALIGRAYTAAIQAASALHTMAVLQVYQADLLRKMDEAGPNPENFNDLRSATDLALRATKSAAQAIGRNMASLTVTERHLWLTLSDMKESDRATFLDTPVAPSGLFGPAVKGFSERYSEVQKTSQAMRHFLPKRSSSATGRSKQPPNRKSAPQPPPPSASQRRQPRDSQRSRSSSRHRPPPPRGPRSKIVLKAEPSKSS
ncbi:unnamed protein product [Leuciscus chuanchicus]